MRRQGERIWQALGRRGGLKGGSGTRGGPDARTSPRDRAASRSCAVAADLESDDVRRAVTQARDVRHQNHLVVLRR